jgi:hypothetical protein
MFDSLFNRRSFWPNFVVLMHNFKRIMAWVFVVLQHSQGRVSRDLGLGTA